MEILDLRQLRSRDLEPLLEEEKTLWQRSLHWDYSSTAAMVRRFVDAQALSGYAAVEGGQAVGFSFFVYEEDKALIGDLFVSDAAGNGTAAVRLATHVIETLQATPGIRRIEAQLMNSSDPPVRQCFLSRHFQTYRRKFLILPAREFPASVPWNLPDLEVCVWQPRWFPLAGRLIMRAYRGHVDSAITDQYRSRAGASRFLENVIHYPGCGVFSADCSFLAVERRTGLLSGMVLTSAVQPAVAHITQLCVDPEWQGRGVGRSLILRALEELRGHGFEAVTLTVTASNCRALSLYEKLRFAALKEFDAFAWDAPGEPRPAAE